MNTPYREDEELYDYKLNVGGSFSDRKKVYEALSKEPNLIGQDGIIVPWSMDESDKDRAYTSYVCPPGKQEGVPEWTEMNMEELLHSIALAYPQVTITVEALNLWFPQAFPWRPVPGKEAGLSYS